MEFYQPNKEPQSSGCYHSSLLVLQYLPEASSHVSHVSIYFFVAALIWITASLLHLHVCKELMDLPPFRRPRNTQTI